MAIHDETPASDTKTKGGGFLSKHDHIRENKKACQQANQRVGEKRHGFCRGWACSLSLKIISRFISNGLLFGCYSALFSAP
ncbi:MAG: hypothetical protein ACI9CU_001405 [Polaribacter sp.]|jgi:hypothetical protein